MVRPQNKEKQFVGVPEQPSRMYIKFTWECIIITFFNLGGGGTRVFLYYIWRMLRYTAICRPRIYDKCI